MEFYNTNIQIDKKVIDDVFKQIRANTKMLVFGLGHDSKMWYEGTNKNTYFVEDKEEYINLNKPTIPADHIIKYTYNTVVPTSSNLTDAELGIFTIPEQLQKEGPFDIIIIDGPEGWAGRPGRLIPFYWSSKPETIIYADDSVRAFEDLCIKRFFNKNVKEVFEERNKCTKIYMSHKQMRQSNSIGLAIPSSYKHLQKVIQLLPSLEQQTRRPDEVVVSMSSCPEHFQLDINPLSFPVKVLTTSEKQTAGKNRNLAASHLTTDSISFFDADDVMHPQRFQALEEAFNKGAGADIVLHNYNRFDIPVYKAFEHYQFFDMTANKLVRAPSLCAKMSTDFRIPLHQSQVTVRRWVMEKVKFSEEPRSGTDALFCGAVCALPGIISQYIANPLSHYYPSNTFGIN